MRLCKREHSPFWPCKSVSLETVCSFWNSDLFADGKITVGCDLSWYAWHTFEGRISCFSRINFASLCSSPTSKTLFLGVGGDNHLFNDVMYAQWCLYFFCLAQQLIPYFVMEVLNVDGLPGLFISCLFGGALRWEGLVVVVGADGGASSYWWQWCLN